MKTAQELAYILETGSGLVRNQLLEAAAMLLQQAEQTKALKALVDNPRSSAFGKEAEKLADDWLAANGPGGWIDDLRNKCEALEITNAALKADAERYRHLRATTNWVSNSKGQRIDVRKSPELWDAAIDAMKGKS